MSSYGSRSARLTHSPSLSLLYEQNSRLEAHREISDSLLREMKELRLRSETMEKRLRELEIDNAVRWLSTGLGLFRLVS